MNGPTARDFLDAWERANGLSHPERAVVFSALADPGRPPAALWDLPVGTRDAALVSLRTATFGARLDATATCPGCGEILEFELELPSLLVNRPTDAEPDPLVWGPWTIGFRLPSTSDLVAAQAAGGSPRALFARCVTTVERDGVAASAGVVPDEAVEAVEARMAELDPAADIRLDLSCAACGTDWDAPFDIVTVLDRELDAWATATLREVATLARAFGWTEPEVLALGAVRRGHYHALATA